MSVVQLRSLILQLHQGFKSHKFVSPWIKKAIFKKELIIETKSPWAPPHFLEVLRHEIAGRD